MTAIKRREFLGGVWAFGAAILALGENGLARTARSLEASVEIMIDETVATITPDIYGHFIEHLGGVVYDGIWVGEKSRVPNTGGIRTAFIDALRQVKPAVIRYPGGCFADSYNWRDGVGPRASRPRRTNMWIDDAEFRKTPDGPHKYEPNSFGTNEFMRLCQLTGAQPYMAANVRSLGALEFYEWVEYCNSPPGTTTGAEIRATGEMPSREPFGAKYWGIGNESWGCGGNFTPEEYATEFRRFTAAAPRYGIPLRYIASGANGGDLNWTRGFFAKTAEKGERIFDNIYGWGIHYYPWNVSGGSTDDWGLGKSDAIKFDDEQYYELLSEANKMESLINQHWTVMGQYDRAHRTKLIVDEWGAWHGPGTEVAPTHAYSRQSTMRDALVAALTLDTFNRHADKVVMAMPAQVINCLQSLFLAAGDKFVKTPNYYVFEMYAPHQNGRAVRTEFIAPQAKYMRNSKPATFWGLGGSASLNGKTLTLTVVNPHLKEPREAAITVRGARAISGQARVLAASDVRAHNTFDNPNSVELKNAPMTIDAPGAPVFRFPAASVTVLQLTLA